MKCPICGTGLHPGSDRCHSCGYRTPVRSYTAPADQPPPAGASVPPQGRYYQPPKHKGSNLGCFCALAVLIPMILLMIITVIVVFANVMDTITPAVPEPDRFGEGIYETLPAVSEDCFLVEDGELTFLPERWDGSPAIRVPESVGGVTVISIAEDAFLDCDFLTTILLPETVTEIGSRAFSGCARLRGMNLPYGVESIGEGAFAGCAALEAIYIPDSVTAIASGCFDDCAALLFIFYDGTFADWSALYSDYITPFTSANCADGSYFHGVDG